MYSTFWTTIKNLCLELLGQSLEVTFIHLDFEKSAHMFAKNIFSNYCRIITSTNFGFRKIQSSKHLLNYILHQENRDRGLASKLF